MNCNECCRRMSLDVPPLFIVILFIRGRYTFLSAMVPLLGMDGIPPRAGKGRRQAAAGGPPLKGSS